MTIRSCLFSLTAYALQAACLALFLASPALARVEIENLNTPLSVQITSDLNGKTVEPGTPFEAVLNEHHVYDNMQLAAGTRFYGTIDKRTHSRYVARPGYVRLNIEKAQLPDGTVLEFDEDNPSKVYHPDANTPKRAGMLALPFVIVSSAVQMPLKYAVGWDSSVLIPLTIGSKMVVGVTREFIRDDKPKDRPAGHKIGYGIAVGTSIPGFCFVVSKRPEPNLKAGENIDIYLQEEGLAALFALSEQHRTASNPTDE